MQYQKSSCQWRESLEMFEEKPWNHGREISQSFKRISIKKDIYNLGTTGCFWKVLPDIGFGEKGKKCKSGKNLNARLR